MRTTRILIILCGLVTAFPAWADMSGTYVGKAPNMAVLMQIVETSGGSFTGRYEEVVLQANGRLDDTSAAVTGARNAETVVATIKGAILFFTANIPVSGTYRGGVLHLSGGGNIELNLINAEEAEFRAQVVALNAQGQQIVAARTRQQAANAQAALEADRRAKMQALTARLLAFKTWIDGNLPKVDPESQRYRATTDRMRAGLARERTIRGGGQASVARGQLSVEINQLAIGADQLHISHEQTFQDFNSKSEQLGREAIEANAWCQGTNLPSLSSVCPAFLEAQTGLAQRVSALRAAFADLETTWNAQRREQEAIVQASEQAIQ